MLCGRSKSSERAGVQNWVGKIAASTFPQGRDVVENIFVRFNVITCYFISLSFFSSVACCAIVFKGIS